MAIQGFRSRWLAEIDAGRHPGKGFPPDLIRVTQRKLGMLHVAQRLEDLRAPPSNGLHALKDDRVGQHAIKVNDQFRLCFVWTEAGPVEVEFTDYH